MINSKSIENFWTRGDIFSRVHHAMSEAGLINKELNIEDRPVPKINNKNDVLIKMQSASLNFRDLIMIDGGYGPIGGNPPFVPISDGAGIVKEVGKSIKNFKVSDVVIPPFFKGWDSGNMKDNTVFLSLGGKEDGVMQEFMIFKENN